MTYFFPLPFIGLFVYFNIILHLKKKELLLNSNVNPSTIIEAIRKWHITYVCDVSSINYVIAGWKFSRFFHLNALIIITGTRHWKMYFIARAPSPFIAGYKYLLSTHAHTYANYYHVKSVVQAFIKGSVRFNCHWSTVMNELLVLTSLEYRHYIDVVFFLVWKVPAKECYLLLNSYAVRKWKMGNSSSSQKCTLLPLSYEIRINSLDKLKRNITKWNGMKHHKVSV